MSLKIKEFFNSDSSALEKFIAFAYRNHWFGGKCIFLDLDKGKTIVNRQTKFVLHNFSEFYEFTILICIMLV